MSNKIIVRVKNNDEYLFAQRIFLMMGGYNNYVNIKKYEIEQPSERLNYDHPEGLYVALYNDNEIYWYIGGIKSSQLIYDDFSIFRKTYEKYLRIIKLERVLK